MPSPLNRTQRRALTFGRSLANALRSTLSSFSNKQNSCTTAFDSLPSKPLDISRPRNLKRANIPAFQHVQLHFIHRLPVEILAYILVLGAEQDYFFPVVVSHVCSKWREIALHTPSLWTHISLSSKETMWRERIHRARACPLDIHLLPHTTMRGGVRRSQQLDAYTVQWYMQMALPHIHRWRSLEIKLDDAAPFLCNAALSGCTSGIKSHAALLEELSLVYRANNDTNEYCLFSGQAPRLRRVTLDGIRLTWLPSLFGNLTFLDYTHHGFTAGHQAVEDVLSLLAVSSALTELHILYPRKHISFCLPSRTSPNAKRITLPRLVHLHLRTDGPDIPFELAHLVTLLNTPSLQYLKLVDLSRGFHAFPSLKSFFYVYALPASLRMLRIEHGWYDPRMLSPVVHTLPHIRQIIVKRTRATDQVLNVNARTSKMDYTKDTRDPQRHFHLHRLDVQYLSK